MTQELRKLAEAATQGKWSQTPPSGIYQGRMIVTDNRAACIGETHNVNATENAAFIAAANPAAIIAILDERDQLQAENERLKERTQTLLDELALYAARKALAPLSYVEIEVARREWLESGDIGTAYHSAVRFAERHHGIGGTP